MHDHGGPIEKTHNTISMSASKFHFTDWMGKTNYVIIIFTQTKNSPFQLATSADKLEQQLKI